LSNGKNSGDRGLSVGRHGATDCLPSEKQPAESALAKVSQLPFFVNPAGYGTMQKIDFDIFCVFQGSLRYVSRGRPVFIFSNLIEDQIP